ncbi:phosphotransferase [Kribbella sp. NPDC026596]|uniref:phosphotransferase n=1 Tax=Kribbella sp. NPDC026596 TaxID=3155122 RepID=UPI0033D03527
MPWQPSPDWQPLTAGTGQATGGVWLTPDEQVVKRLVPGIQDPRHHAYWERQALVAESGVVATTPGLRSPACLAVERDPTGITLRMAYVPPAPWTPVALAAALGRFARSSVTEPSWVARDVPRTPSHGDAHPINLIGRDSDDVLAIDWEQFGLAPTGFDLACLLLAGNTPLDDLLAAHAGNTDVVRRGVTLIAAYTTVSRAAWSLTQPTPGNHVNQFLMLSNVVEEAAGHIA